MADEKQNRNTRQKSLILRYIRERKDRHIRAEDIINDLNAHEEQVGKTTVYRVLKSLETEGKIRKYTLSDKSPACYQYSGSHPECRHHYHLMCSQCGRLIHFNSVLMAQVAEEIMDKADFSVDESKTVFYGCCSECRSRQTEVEDKMQIDSMIFDFDGTLWDSSDGIVATWGIVLENYPEIRKTVTAEELADNFGLPLDEIARRMFPDQTEELRQRLMAECCVKENLYLAEHGGKLYPKLEETLQKLSEKIPLFIVSNCQDGYIQSFYSGNKMQKYFKDCECIGVTGLSKGENIRLVMERNGLKSPVYVGDTQGDADAAKAAGIPFIYARYGFGNVDGYDMHIDHFEELLKLL